ncbi:uncharacterized protein LOC144027522 [Festucalex cinctus]
MDTKVPSDLLPTSMTRRFAVVVWCNGEDAGKYSEVKTDAIKSYDDSKFDDNGYPVSDYLAIVEWQKGKKPKHGWPVYRASVKFVSSNRFQTNGKIKQYLSVNKDEHLPKKRPSIPPCRYTDSDSETDLGESPQTQSKKQSITKPQKNVAKKLIDKYQPIFNQQQTQKLNELEEENTRLRSENEKLKNMLVREIPDMIGELKTALKSRGSTTSFSSDFQAGQISSPSVQQTSASGVHDHPKSSIEDQVEIVPGSIVHINKLAWAVAQNANSASCFIRTLLTAVFPMDVLLVSNLRGTSRDSSGTRRQALEKNKVDAIYRATLQKWPHVIPSHIGTVINSKLSEIRAKNKPKNLDPETIMLFDNSQE